MPKRKLRTPTRAFFLEKENKKMLELLFGLWENDYFEYYEEEGALDQRACEILYEAGLIQRCQGNALKICFRYRNFPEKRGWRDHLDSWICDECAEEL